MKNKTVFVTNIWISYFLKARFSQLLSIANECDVEFFRDIPSREELHELLKRPKFKKYFGLPTE